MTRIVILGKGDSGKSSLANAFLYGNCSEIRAKEAKESHINNYGKVCKDNEHYFNIRK